MPDAIAAVMGGPDKAESRDILKRFGYTDKEIKKLEETTKMIKDIIREVLTEKWR